MDTILIRSRPVIMVDQASHFSAAAFLKIQTVSKVFKSIYGLWNLVYLGTTDLLMVYQGSNDISKEFKENFVEIKEITIDEATIETLGSIGTF